MNGYTLGQFRELTKDFPDDTIMVKFEQEYIHHDGMGEFVYIDDVPIVWNIRRDYKTSKQIDITGFKSDKHDAITAIVI